MAASLVGGNVKLQTRFTLITEQTRIVIYHSVYSFIFAYMSAMKKIGLVGGISWTSTVDYYRMINEEVNKSLGGLQFAECIIYSVNFDDFRKANAAYDWDATFRLMLTAAEQLEKAGAEVLLLGANTAHIVAERVSAQIRIPCIDIRVATANAIHNEGLSKVGLLGTTYTMELDYYTGKLSENQIEAITPDSAADRSFIEETLLHELGKGILREDTKREYLRIADDLIARGAEGIILGCTEIPLLLNQSDFAVPVFNTTEIHVQAAVRYALQ
jgi:aspartate racemase